MNPRLWLGCSVTLNVILLAILVTPARLPVPVASSVSITPTQPAMVSRPGGDRLGADPGAGWPLWIHALRSQGVPAAVLADVVSADFEQRWQDRRRSLQRRHDAGEIDGTVLTRADRDRERELEEELRSALGAEGYAAWDERRTMRDVTLSGIQLSTAESAQVYGWRKERERQERGLTEANERGDIDETELSERLSALATEYEAKFKPLLGDERYATFTAEGSDLRGEIRRQLGPLHVDQQKLADLAEAQRASDRQLGQIAQQQDSGTLPPAAYETRRLAIEAARDSAFHEVLGPEAFVRWQKQQNAAYQAMTRYAVAWRLQPAEIEQVYATLNAHARKAGDVYQASLTKDEQRQPVDWTAVDAQVGELSTQMAQALRGALGHERYEKLRRADVLRVPGETR